MVGQKGQRMEMNEVVLMVYHQVDSKATLKVQNLEYLKVMNQEYNQVVTMGNLQVDLLVVQDSEQVVQKEYSQESTSEILLGVWQAECQENLMVLKSVERMVYQQVDSKELYSAKMKDHWMDLNWVKYQVDYQVGQDWLQVVMKALTMVVSLVLLMVQKMEMLKGQLQVDMKV